MSSPVVVADGCKACLGCGALKPLDAFYRNAGGLGGRQPRCKPCFMQQVRATPGFRQRKAARDAVRVAIAAGRLVRPTACALCGAVGSVHAHHDDYARKLDVRWLCHPCHEKAHAGQTYKPRRG